MAACEGVLKLVMKLIYFTMGHGVVLSTSVVWSKMLYNMQGGMHYIHVCVKPGL